MEKAKLIEFLENNAKIAFEPEEEHLEVRGNFIVSDNPDYDKEAEDEILNHLEKGELSYWFSAKVTATYDNFHGVDYLGGCSYESFEEFEKDNYYENMVAQAIDDLAEQIIARKHDLEKIEKLVA